VAKSSKDITSFEGGLINAVEPSDSGEENGMYNVENLEGLYKKGVLVPSGQLADKTTGIYPLDGANQQGGVGYGIMQSDWEYASDLALECEFENNDGSAAAKKIYISSGGTGRNFTADWKYNSGDGTEPTWTREYSSGGSIMSSWNGTSANNGHGKIANFRVPYNVSGNQQYLESNRLYRITVESFQCNSSGLRLTSLADQFTYFNGDVHGPLDGSMYIAPLHTAPTDGGWVMCWDTMWGNYGKPITNIDALGNANDIKVYYMVTHGTISNSDQLHFGCYFDAHCMDAGNRGVALRNIKIDVAEQYNGTQYYFHAKDDGLVSVHENENTAASDAITVQGSAVTGNDPNYLLSSNVARIQGTDFADYGTILAPKWFGMIRRNFFKYVEDLAESTYDNGIMEGVVSTGDDTTGPWLPISTTAVNDVSWNYSWTMGDHYQTAKIPFSFESKLHGWETESTQLEAPNADYCTLVNVNDQIQLFEKPNYTTSPIAWYNTNTDSGAWFGQDLMCGDGTYHQHFGASAGYLIRLEYHVDKREITANVPISEDITGTWNEAEDTETPSPAELGVTYRFYCTFMYDSGSQESVMTRIKIGTETGTVVDGSTPQGQETMYKNSSSPHNYLRDQFQLRMYSNLTAATTSKLAHDTRVTFRPMIIPSSAGMHGWDLPKRCSGVNWYYSTDKDNHTSRWKLIETDFVKGIKPHSSANAAYLPWKLLRFAWPGYYGANASGGSADVNQSVADGGALANRFPLHQGYSHDSNANPDGIDNFLQFDDPPKFEDWNSAYGSNPDETDDIFYKTSTIIGSQAFYGNVLINGESYRDRILVSIANHGYDMIPFDNYLDVAAGDGDEIVSLLTHNEQLYVFKKRSLQVVSVGEDNDETVATSAIGGIDNKHHAIATNIGIIWANEYGVFLHGDGQVENLIQGKVNDFGLNNSDRFTVGYSPRYNRVFIMSSTSKAVPKTLHMIDTNEKTWWRSVGSAATNSVYSNFMTDKDMKLTCLKDIDAGAWTVIRQEWNPQSVSQNVLFEVGDLNLDGVTSNKQLYSIITVAKNAGSLNIVAEQTKPDGTKSTLTLTPSSLSASPTGYGRVEHVVQVNTAEDLLFANATISGTADAAMEVHSVSFIYRDKGVK